MYQLLQLQRQKGSSDYSKHSSKARIEVLENEKISLKRSLETSSKKPFWLADIAHDDRRVRSYSDFPSYIVLLAFLTSSPQFITLRIREQEKAHTVASLGLSHSPSFINFSQPDV